MGPEPDLSTTDQDTSSSNSFQHSESLGAGRSVSSSNILAFRFAFVGNIITASGFAQPDPNLTGIRGEGNAKVDGCQALLGWLRDFANWGQFNIPGAAWDKTGQDYLSLLWTDDCSFGAFRTGFQPEDMQVGALDIAEVIDVSVKYFCSPYRQPPWVEADGFMYCQTDIPFGWGLYNKFANEQHQWDIN
ncbi:hypothetical protein PG994_004112 [Apiospora phragmitis]|uniref:Ecp2 effector protein-like domain-containing protein n=1 Tax=Apiospora phragmitis TaxID=2905665 RepID=A0ABR1VPN7_9PEZI